MTTEFTDLGPFCDPNLLDLDRRAFGDAIAAIGEPGSLALLPTPALVCEMAPLLANIASMQEHVRDSSLSLRPHAKSHKTVFIADLQVREGAVGVSCAKVAEAEAICDAYDRIDVAPPPILLTSPIVGDAAAARVAKLAGRTILTVAVDDQRMLHPLAHAMDEDVTCEIVIDVDTGMGRTGVTSITAADDIARAALEFDNLYVTGLQAYAGHVQHLADATARAAANADAMKLTKNVISSLTAKGLELGLRTGGGTGSAEFDPAQRVLNELQPGSYVFMDREYRDALGDECGYAQSLFVLTTVISANSTDHVTVDAGFKALATDAGDPVVADDPNRGYRFFGDEHGLVTNHDRALALGDRLRLVPAHCDPTVNLHDLLWLIDADTIVGVAPVIARGRGY